MGSRELFWGAGGKFTLNPMVECPLPAHLALRGDEGIVVGA